MSSETVKQITDNLSTFQVLNYFSSKNSTNDLIHRIMPIVNERLDNAQEYKIMFNENSMQPAIYQILCEIKNKIALNTRQISNFNDQASEQLIRVDNMLLAEGISEQNPSVKTYFDNTDYQTKLTQIKQIYKFELDKYENHCNDFCSHVITLLHQQSQIRPITEQEIQYMILIIRKKFSHIQLQLKQSTCEALMILRSKFLDARRKRKNFSKSATHVLNEYFYSHLSNPYPSDEAKEELARQCGISIGQVSNWFGNKRIRYKKNINKTQE